MVTWNTINDNMTLNAIFSDTSHASETEGPWQLHFRALSIMEKTEPLQIRFTLRLRDQWSEWIQDECKVYMDSSMASNGSCFMVTWIIFKNHLLEVGLTQNRKTIPLWNLTTVDLLYFIMCEDPAWIEIIEITFGWGLGHIWVHTTLRAHDHVVWSWKLSWNGVSPKWRTHGLLNLESSLECDFLLMSIVQSIKRV